ncbi:MAG: NAD(P)-dependent glycerol-3-phosphate dehydrogenase [Deltaproteobacteria bacterium]|nr:NAD(P)-dependent glycerol-3-phosphate dehydrogenase [Deltaproteobacteria bacterium]
MKIAVLGGGSWGTALANVLAEKGEDVWLWVRRADQAGEIANQRTNSRYLPGRLLSSGLRASTDLASVVDRSACVVLAVPCQQLGAVLRQGRLFFSSAPRLVCASKGVEMGSFRTMSRIVGEELRGLDPLYAMLSGPSFASEVAARMPTAVALGCADPGFADFVQTLFSTEFFRVYVNADVTGVELGGAVKNIIAIASGISDGLGFGENARAALITRGLAEMSRLGLALGAKAATFMGLSGMGDLVLTCTGDLSRNRRVGLGIGRGQTLEQVLAGMHNVAEGVKTTEAVHALGKERGLELPITAQVHAVLFGGKDPALAVRELMTRPLREE